MKILIIVNVIFLAYISLQLMWLRKEVRGDKKDQQEIKTRLHWLKEGINAVQKKFRVRG